MKLRSVSVRFYKSFNYDYIRKITEDVHQRPWELVAGQFYPHVQISIDPMITTIVGANESGKSHLLSAIEKGITGFSTSGGQKSNIGRKDFCRYSHFFRSTTGGPRYPDFGFEWTDLSQDEQIKVCNACEIPHNPELTSFFSFRNGKQVEVFLPSKDSSGYDRYEVDSKKSLPLPHVFRIESDIALPDSVPIKRLIDGRIDNDDDPWGKGREYTYALVEAAPELLAALNALPVPQPQQPAGLTFEAHQRLMGLKKSLETDRRTLKEDERQRQTAEFNLAHDLIFKIADIDVEDIRLLYSALHNAETGIVRSIVDNINSALASKLNFPRVWAQDRDFALRVEALEHELSFVISDRTGRQYSFAERSSGLKHFLSYYIQYLTHEPIGLNEILLMDEPDAFLSGEAQQDLLKVFQMFAFPSQSDHTVAVPVQVIYVTHSPFLIDKNHSERVRAVEKAEGAKGTRVINGAAQNHYEPLRSAFGSFVGETTFISHCNLFVEGPGDQILLAGAASYLRRLLDVPESELLDLNRITIVPSGGASNVPYMVYLARGRDTEKPAVIVLLDSDKGGNEAKAALGKDGPHPRKKQVLDPKFILQLGDISLQKINSEQNQTTNLTNQFSVIEDLVPLPFMIKVARRYVQTVYGILDSDLVSLNMENATKKTQGELSSFDAINDILGEIDSVLHVDKIPFARTVVDLLPEMSRDRHLNGVDSVDGLDQFEKNMRALFKRLRSMQTMAEQEVKDKRMRQKVGDKVSTFLSDYPTSLSATRDDAARLLDDIESDLEGDDTEKSFVFQEILKLRTNYRLSEDMTESIRDFDQFVESLRRLQNIRELAFKPNNNEIAPRKLPTKSIKFESSIEEEKNPMNEEILSEVQTQLSKMENSVVEQKSDESKIINVIPEPIPTDGGAKII